MTTTAAPPPQTRPSTFAEAEVILAANLPGYEGRAEQQHLAHRIETDFFGHDHGTKDDPEPRAMFAQAPTGTGKSLAYLIPAVCSGKRVVVSVTTKALQDQLSGVDLPFLAEHFTFSWAVLKGRSSYLCVNRLLDAADGEIVRKTDLLKWVETVEDFSGYRDDLPFPVTDFEWTAMCSDSDYCSVKGCSYTECYAARARSRALGASIVVVNHALYFTDLAIGVQTAGAVTMVGDHEWVIFDEGHEMHEVASNSLSDRLTERGFTNLTSKAVSLAHRSGASDEQARSHAGALDRAVKAFFDGLPVDRRGDSLRLTVGHLEASFESVTAVMDAIDALGVFMKSVLPGDDDGRGAKIKIMRTLRRYRERMIQFVSDEMTETVRWTVMETRNRQQVKVLEMAPVDISGYLNEHLWSKTRGMVVSATLSVGGKFEFQADQLGVEHYVGTLTDSPFDFVRQGRLYVPAHLPPPQRKEQWEAATLDEIRALVRATGGRTLVLFPSVAHMRSTFRAIGDMLGVDVRMQGDGMPNRDLGRWFLDNETSVLFGTKSFMTGFDARGKTCISVIIAKLPFPVPSEPLVQARCEKIVAEGGSDFFDYSIPVMTTLLQQAVGRAHRHTTDWAMVSILDSRLVGKGYGRRVLGDMPNMPVITKRADAEAFAAQIVDHYEYV